VNTGRTDEGSVWDNHLADLDAEDPEPVVAAHMVMPKIVRLSSDPEEGMLGMGEVHKD
jgi:hypothetical protein